MNILIDAYNVIKQILKKTLVSQKERDWFLSRMASYAKRKSHTLYIIFDGGPYDRPTEEKKGPLVIVYSGRRDTADDVIKAYVEENVLHDMLVVSTDRQLGAWVRNYGVPSIDSVDFYAFVSDKPPAFRGFKKVQGKAHKLSQDEDSYLDELMQEASMVLQYKDDLPGEEEDKAKKLSKKEKLMQKVLKKL